MVVVVEEVYWKSGEGRGGIRGGKEGRGRKGGREGGRIGGSVFRRCGVGVEKERVASVATEDT